jgi:hypothetical protein
MQEIEKSQQPVNKLGTSWARALYAECYYAECRFAESRGTFQNRTGYLKRKGCANIEQNQGLCSQHCIFFVTYEWAQ